MTLEYQRLYSLSVSLCPDSSKLVGHNDKGSCESHRALPHKQISLWKYSNGCSERAKHGHRHVGVRQLVCTTGRWPRVGSTLTERHTREHRDS